MGTHVLLGRAAPSLDSPSGTALLAHEVAHVVQQSRAAAVVPGVSSSGSTLERAADEGAGAALAGRRAQLAGGTVPSVQCQAGALSPDQLERIRRSLRPPSRTADPDSPVGRYDRATRDRRSTDEARARTDELSSGPRWESPPGTRTVPVLSSGLLSGGSRTTGPSADAYLRQAHFSPAVQDALRRDVPDVEVRLETDIPVSARPAVRARAEDLVWRTRADLGERAANVVRVHIHYRGETWTVHLPPMPRTRHGRRGSTR